ncbi:MAG: sigma-54 dependent transcriptional regulator [Verrucomicrobiota bacterium]|nr:sigma-54 dependent transcriptional regulator [Verrucomicrobiota bacterium]MDQ6938849.1 sigma-54 dependent transcriptional regulator [Verrucomicrobiota bacterium]
MQAPLSGLKLEDLTTTTDAMARCLQLAAVASKSDVPVVLLGETGTGKTLLAHAIHNSSLRAGRPFVSFNASAMSDTLLESQLFGHERGAFTGAQQAVKGKFELAHTGTLFLDEISEMSALAQVKILRALEYGEFERLGSERMLRCDVRIICAANCSLRQRVADGKFREDLFHRLNGVTLLIPPLRERLEELPALIATELKASAVREGKKIRAIHPEAMARLLAHDWRGNLRELSHTVHTMTLFCEGGVILPENVIFSADLPESPSRAAETKTPDAASDANGQDLSLSSALTRHVQFVFARANRNQRLTAKLLGISRSTLARYLQNVSHPEANGSISNPEHDSN